LNLFFVLFFRLSSSSVDGRERGCNRSYRFNFFLTVLKRLETISSTRKICSSGISGSGTRVNRHYDEVSVLSKKSYPHSSNTVGKSLRVIQTLKFVVSGTRTALRVEEKEKTHETYPTMFVHVCWTLLEFYTVFVTRESTKLISTKAICFNFEYVRVFCVTNTYAKKKYRASVKTGRTRFSNFFFFFAGQIFLCVYFFFFPRSFVCRRPLYGCFV